MSLARGLLRLLAEGARVARSQRVVSALTLLTVAITTGASLVVSGQSVVAERAALSQLDAAQTRLVRIEDRRGDAGIPAQAVKRLQQLSDVAWVVALGTPRDVRNSRLSDGPAAPAVVLLGVSPFLRTWSGSPPAPRLALVSASGARRLGLLHTVGAVGDAGGRQTAVVGGFAATEPLADLDRYVLLREPTYAGPVSSLVVAAREPEQTQRLTVEALAVLGAARPASVTTSSPADLLRTRAAVRREVSRQNRLVAAATLLVGLIMLALVSTAAVATRRRDFGRRRALGAQRWQVVVLVLAQVGAPSLLGVLVGLAAGVGWVRASTGGWLGASYPVAVGVLALLAAAAAGVVPAVLASRRDPVHVLRVP